MYQWAACMMSLVISNLACIALCSYFSSIVPSKRNLLNRVSIKPQNIALKQVFFSKVSVQMSVQIAWLS